MRKKCLLLVLRDIPSFDKKNLLILRRKNQKMVYKLAFLAPKNILKKNFKLGKKPLKLMGILEKKTWDC